MSRSHPTVRLEAIALVAAGSLLVHDGRYAAADGARWQNAIAETGHSYLSFALPLIALALGGAIRLVARNSAPARASRRPRSSFLRTWLIATVALCAIYTGQELLEGMLSAEHAVGMAGVVEDGGWSAFVLAPFVGVAIAALLCAAHAAVALIARTAPGLSLPVPAAPFVAAPAFAGVRLRDAMASHLAGRGPPLTG